MRKHSISSQIASLFKPYFVRRPNGGCQVLFPLTELDNLVEQAITIATYENLKEGLEKLNIEEIDRIIDLRTTIDLQFEKIQELENENRQEKIGLYREIFNLSNYIKHIAGISNTSVQHYWPDTCETCKEIRLELEKNDSRINRLLSLLED